jgi:hypothetical protein
MQKRRSPLKTFANIILISSILTPLVIVFLSHKMQLAMAASLFLFGIFIGFRIVISKIVGQIEGAEMVLKNLPKDGENIDLSLYYNFSFR